MWGDLSILHVEHLSPPRSLLRRRGDRREGQARDRLPDRQRELGTERMPVVVESGATRAVVIPQGATGDVTIGDQCDHVR